VAIQVFRPSYDQREIDAVAEVMRSGWVGLGPMTARFEEAFARYCGVPFCVGTSCGTAALDMVLKLMGIGEGDEVIVPVMTYVSTAHCVAANGARPVFADVEPATLNVDPSDVARKLSRRTKLVIPVHYAGRPVRLDRLEEVAGGIPLVEDCAHAAGARYRGIPVGGLGAAGCFSFHAVKNLAMGEGGAITLRDGETAERARRLRGLGIDRSTWDRSKLDRAYWWEYAVEEIGLKCCMDDIHAAIGLVQLEKLDAANARRRSIVGIYREGLDSVTEIEMPPVDDSECLSSWHICEVRARRRDDLNVHLGKLGISTSVHYKPLHLYRCYGYQESLPNAEKAFESILTLPPYPDLTDDEAWQVVEGIRDFYRGA
jgi:perosamine synthetase